MKEGLQSAERVLQEMAAQWDDLPEEESDNEDAGNADSRPAPAPMPPPPPTQRAGDVEDAGEGAVTPDGSLSPEVCSASLACCIDCVDRV